MYHMASHTAYMVMVFFDGDFSAYTFMIPFPTPQGLVPEGFDAIFVADQNHERSSYKIEQTLNPEWSPMNDVGEEYPADTLVICNTFEAWLADDRVLFSREQQEPFQPFPEGVLVTRLLLKSLHVF